eukprot:1992322-Rhodomonas_salina.1
MVTKKERWPVIPQYQQCSSWSSTSGKSALELVPLPIELEDFARVHSLPEVDGLVGPIAYQLTAQ